MYIKIIGALLITVGCGGYGMLLAKVHRKEVKLLHQLMGVLEMMRSELEYRLTPVPLLCRSCTSDTDRLLRDVFTAVADQLEKQEATDASTAMAVAIEHDKRLPPITAAQLRQLGQTLGRFDLSGQARGFTQCAQECANKLNELECNQQQRLRGYQTLSFCTGAALAILLF